MGKVEEVARALCIASGYEPETWAAMPEVRNQCRSQAAAITAMREPTQAMTKVAAEGHTYAIPDLHGRYDLLCAALDRIEASPSGGTIVFLGDYVDRGPQSREIVERLMAGPSKPNWRWICLKGNHEDMMVAALRGEAEFGWWVGNGGGQTLASFDGDVPAECVEWADKLPQYHQDAHRIFVHADADETKPMSDQTEARLLWSRRGKHQDCQHPEGYVVHGHTPFEDGPIILSGRANLDAGAVWTGNLAVAVFDDDIPGGPVEVFAIRSGS